MSALRELQSGFVEAVLKEGRIAGLDESRLSAEVATAIYRNNVLGNVLNALYGAFPALRALLGDACFEGMTLRYLSAYPSRSGDLHDLGADMPEFLTAVPEFTDLEYLPDVARLEWLQRLALIAADADAFDFEGLAGVAEEAFGTLHFRLAPAVRWLCSPWPVFSIWHLARSEAAGELGDGVEPGAGGEQTMVYRKGAETVLTESLSRGGAKLLEEFCRGTEFGVACERVWTAEPGMDVGACLQGFVAKGVVCAWYR